nr:hypothetical protein [uncultured Mediterranean phage uvMED]
MRNLFETCIDVGSGLILSTVIQLFIFPFFGLYPTVLESFHIAVIFTAISICRSWFWRTLFGRIR